MKRLFLLSILLLGFLFRVVALDKYPSGFTPDEASYGFDAYSMLKTGKDQWGKTLPLVLESFGDYKSPLYAYISIPFVALFGLSKYSVRLPNAFIGTLAIYVVYLLVQEIIKYLQIKSMSRTKSDFVALMAAFLLAISPWNIMMSRGAFEANLTILLLPLALYFFIRGLKNSKYFVWSAIVVGLNVFSYHSAKLVTPIVFISAIILFRKELLKNFGIYHKICLLILIAFMFLFFISLKGGSSTRILNVNIFKTSLLEASSERIKAINQGLNPVLARIVYNKYQAGLRHFFGNYITYFSPQFYFSQGPAESTYGMIPGRGVLYWFELPILVLGFLYISKNINKIFFIIIIWYLVAPIPAALSIGPGYAANRAEVMLPSIQIICALGLFYLIHLVDSLRYKKLFIAVYGFSVLVFVCYFSFDYFILSPQKISSGMLYGNLEAIEYVKRHYPERIIAVSKGISEPHIYVAFANKWNPKDYLKSSRNWNYKQLGLGWVDQIPEYKLGEYTFTNITYQRYLDQNVVLVGKQDEFSKNTTFDILFQSPNGDRVIGIIDMGNQKYAQVN
jgi:4-amino-4-deoxy-L-arabinose transferase-like glycosyltransferase